MAYASVLHILIFYFLEAHTHVPFYSQIKSNQAVYRHFASKKYMGLGSVNINKMVDGCTTLS